MFAYARNMQLALTDKLRRAGITAGAGLFLLLGLGFLLAALWTWLAHHLGWGALGASAAIGGGFLVIGAILLLVARKERHKAPTTDELKSEIETQVNQMADAAISRASAAADATFARVSGKAGRMMGLAGQKVNSAADSLSYKADRYADRAEGSARRMARDLGDKTRNAPNAAVIAPLIGAFALGITLAGRVQDWRHRRDEPDWAEGDLPDFDAPEEWDEGRYRR